MNAKLESYIAFHDQKIKKAMNRRKYNICARDKLILEKILILAKEKPELFQLKQNEFNTIIMSILKKSKVKR